MNRKEGERIKSKVGGFVAVRDISCLSFLIKNDRSFYSLRYHVGRLSSTRVARY